MRWGWRMIPNALAALGRAVRRKARGKTMLATTATVLARTGTCEGCPFYDPESDQCGRCLCFVTAKVRLESENCPEGFW